MRRPLVLRVVLAALLPLALSAAPAFASLAPASAEIRLTERGFAPRAVDVEVGEVIVWINTSRAEQTVVGEDGSWDSGPLRPGETFSIALRDPGTVRYATADGRREGAIRVHAPVDEHPTATSELPEAAVAVEHDASAEDADQPAEDTLPDTGPAPGGVLSGALLLVGAGWVVLRRSARAADPAA